MTQKTFYISVALFTFLIVLSNYTVQFAINDWLTYGAIVYPITFLLADVLVEKYSKEEVFRVMKYSIGFTIVPTILLADYRIALASISAFAISHIMDISIFHYIKKKAEKLWWLRNNISTLIAQFFDTVIFFVLAFAWVMPFEMIIKLIIGDYMVKIVMALLDTPFFYLFAIKAKQKLPFSS